VRIAIEKLASDPRIGDKLGWIACSASSGDSGNRMARDFSAGVNHFANAIAGMGAKIDLDGLARLQSLERR
jgi:hypothetical protein